MALQERNLGRRHYVEHVYHTAQRVSVPEGGRKRRGIIRSETRAHCTIVQRGY